MQSDETGSEALQRMQLCCNHSRPASWMQHPGLSILETPGSSIPPPLPTPCIPDPASWTQNSRCSLDSKSLMQHPRPCILKGASQMQPGVPGPALRPGLCCPLAEAHRPMGTELFSHPLAQDASPPPAALQTLKCSLSSVTNRLLSLTVCKKKRDLLVKGNWFSLPDPLKCVSPNTSEHPSPPRVLVKLLIGTRAGGASGTCGPKAPPLTSFTDEKGEARANSALSES